MAKHKASELATDDLSASEKLDPSVWKISTVAMFGTLLAQLDGTIVNVSLSSLSANLHASLSTIQWSRAGIFSPSHSSCP